MIDYYFTLYQKMKSNGVALYGAGAEGELAISVLSEESIDIIAVSDKVAGKRIGDFITISFDELLSIDKDVVCIITPTVVPKLEWEKCENYFDTVVNNMFVHIIKYFIPDNHKLKCFPFNHYESPYHSREELLSYKDTTNESVLDIDFNLEYQEEFLKKILDNKEEFKEFLRHDIRYKADNGYYNYVDAFVYFSVIKLYRPKRIIEIGSGFSTCLALDINEKYNYNIQINSIEPYPDVYKTCILN